MKKVLVVIVTHNSSKYINWAIEPLKNKELLIRIVDSGSTDLDYLKDIENSSNVDIIYKENIGFAKGNNIALFDVENYDFVLFLNPDARVESDILDILISRAYLPEYDNVAIFSVPLIKYDINNNTAMNMYDSLGIYCDWLGRWKDRRGIISMSSLKQYEAICGAFMLCRTHILQTCKDSNGNIGFEESFKMYKEDIELSLRVKKSGLLHIFSDLYAFHCRGWGNKRKNNPYWTRLCSAENDMVVAFKYKWRALPFALLKLIYVRYFEGK